jgi:hypothetical protein
MGTPIQPAPYCDSYLTQISKSKLKIIQYKLQNLKDMWQGREIVSKIIQKTGMNMSAIENFVDFVLGKTMMMV